MERQGEGIPGRDGLLHQIKEPQDNFRVAVRRTAPCFVPRYRDKPASEEPEPTLAKSSASACPPFLIGEEVSDEFSLNDGKEVFIDDVLETAEWCVPWLCGVNLTQAHKELSNQCGDTRTTEQLSFHSPEGVHRSFCPAMG